MAISRIGIVFLMVKQNWFGFSLVGNGGSGLGINFARELHANLHVAFVNFGEEKITEGSHLEKVCLVSNGVGRDNISDFVTNLIQDFLCQFTERFAAQFLDARHVREVTISRAVFNYATQTWQRKAYRLPWIRGDFVLLTPRAMLTRDDTWINRADLLGRFDEIPTAIPDAALRAAVSNYFDLALRQRANPRKSPTQKDKASAAVFTYQERQKVDRILKKLGLHGNEDVILIDARSDNKPSASRAK